ncbi:hypothetical protein BDV06DRAFT_208111 [Aspergillus oleicola]
MLRPRVPYPAVTRPRLQLRDVHKRASAYRNRSDLKLPDDLQNRRWTVTSVPARVISDSERSSKGSCTQLLLFL